METNNTMAPSSQSAKKNTKVVKWALILGIIIVLNLFFNYTIHLLYEEPKFETFCPNDLNVKVYQTSEECTTVGGQWVETTVPVTADAKGMTKPLPANTVQISGYCNATYTCSMHFNDAQSVYNRNVFIILVILGVISLVLGITVFSSVGAVSLGLAFGGVVSLIIGSMRYWSDMNDVIRVVILAVALAALIWVGVKKMKE